MPIAADIWGQLVLGLLGIASTIATGIVSARLVNARRQHAESIHQKELELEKQKQATARANAELERAAAESQRIRDQSAADIIKARSEARQGNEMLDMVRGAFNRIADTNIANNEAQALTAAALNKNSETINLLALTVQDNHKQVITGLNEITLLFRDLPKVVDGTLAPLYEHVEKLGTAVNGLSPLVQGLQLYLLTHMKQASASPDHNNHTDEVKSS